MRHIRLEFPDLCFPPGVLSCECLEHTYYTQTAGMASKRSDGSRLSSRVEHSSKIPEINIQTLIQKTETWTQISISSITALLTMFMNILRQYFLYLLCSVCFPVNSQGPQLLESAWWLCKTTKSTTWTTDVMMKCQGR